MFSPGQRIKVRDEDFLISNVEANFDDSFLIYTEGISELVKGKRFVFDTALDPVKPLNPLETVLVPDTEAGYRKTKLFIETSLRNAPITSGKITIAQKGAFNPAEYQLTPTIKALGLPRPRILIADGVGLGKTIEVGIFLAEMIRRGKGARIMVLALKSILGQFQQELWQRFAIPLVRLDSVGIDRVKTQLPANKNPFEYYDKTIISIDTLKNNAKFRLYIEKTRWDIIVIDECHTVANTGSQRGDLANLLAGRCESLVLTSATPHNGRREAFANLIRMIEPTAVPRTGAFTKGDVEPYYVRRFKHHIEDDSVRANFQERKVMRGETVLLPEEEAFLQYQQSLKFEALSRKKGAKPSPDFLFATSLFKAYMSSPAAALATVQRRLQKATAKAATEEGFENNVEVLQTLERHLQTIMEKGADSKYKKFRDTLQDLGWKGRQRDDRYVVFAERIDTLNYLEQSLIRDFGLKKEETIRRFDGSLSDTEQQAIVEDFGTADSNCRLLLCSDAGSQGVNLHYFCHRMFNYDVPWSLITLEQRNGRIDRYGQKETPFIHYLITASNTPGLKTDLHILDVLTKKEEEVYRTLGDAGSVMKLYDAGREEAQIEQALWQGAEDPFAAAVEAIAAMDFSFLSGGDSTPATVTEQPVELQPTLYPFAAAFYKDLFEQLVSAGQLQVGQVASQQPGYVELQNSPELNDVLYDLPQEAKPKLNGLYRLALDEDLVQASIAEARRAANGEWARMQVLYELHPAIRYCLNKLEASVPKDAAPVAKTAKLPAGTAWYLVQGQVSNQMGQPVISEAFAVQINLHECKATGKPLPMAAFIQRFGIAEELYTAAISEQELNRLHACLDMAVDWGQYHMRVAQQKLEAKLEQQLADYEGKLRQWKDDSLQQLELDFAEKTVTHFWKTKKESRHREIQTILHESSQYYQNLLRLRDDAYLKVLAVFFNT